MEKQFVIDDLKLGESWRLFRIMGEFVEGVEKLHDLGPAVSIFGSARTAPNDPAYQKAVHTAALFAKENFAVITGGGGGIMQAGQKFGMQTMNQSLYGSYVNRSISYDDALGRSSDRDELLKMIGETVEV